jgi:hypothetical protein
MLARLELLTSALDRDPIKVARLAVRSDKLAGTFLARVRLA